MSQKGGVLRAVDACACTHVAGDVLKDDVDILPRQSPDCRPDVVECCTLRMCRSRFDRPDRRLAVGQDRYVGVSR